MANYYMDENGNITRKRKSKGNAYYMDENGKITLMKDEEEEDIAPVREEITVPAKSKKEDDKKLDFFKASGAWDDGYQFGDVTKATLGTVGDTGLQIGKGAAGLGEGITDAILYGAAGLFDLKESKGIVFDEDDPLYQKPMSEKIRDLARQDSVENTVKPAEEYLDNYSVLGRTSKAVAQGVGQVGAILATGGMAGAVGLGGAGATALTTAVTGVSGFGSGTGEAYKGGATDAEAYTYGAIAGAADALTELLFGGLGKSVKAVGLSSGVSSLDDIVAKKVSGVFKNQIAKNFTEFGIKAGAEGVEEVLAGLTQAVGKKITYMSEEELSKIIEDENLLEQFVVGAVTSGIAQSGVVPGMKNGSLIEANKTGRDFITGNTQNEQAVIDAEVNDRITEAEKDGKKLTGQQKNKIIEQVKSDLEKGYISTDTIERVLGGTSYNQFKQGVDGFMNSETYKAYNDAISEEKSLREEFEELQKVKITDADLGQQSRFNEVKNRLEEIKKEAKSTSLRKKLDAEINRINGLKDRLRQEVSEKVKDERLAESYREFQRSTEKFQADPMQYDNEYARKTVQNIVDSGIANNTNETREFVDFMAKISADKGVVFSLTDAERLAGTRYAKDGAVTNAYVTDSGDIVINGDSKKRLNSLVGHEVTHVLEGTEFYGKLQEAVFAYAQKKGDYDSRLKAITELYQKYDPKADPKKELTADLVGDYLFTDRDFINNLSTEHRNVFQKIYDEIKYLVKVATAGSKEARALEKAKKMFEAAYRENVKTQKNTADGGVKYHISETFSEEIDKTLNNEMKKASQVKARDYTPEILVDNGVKDLPMLITQKHIKTIVYSEAEAKAHGLPTGDKYHYHGMGKDLLVRSIDNMDDPAAIYKQDNDHYLIITELKDSAGNDVLIPVKIDGRGNYNDVYIDENQILTAYGKKNLQEYLKNNNFELIYRKRGTALNEWVQFPNISNSSTDIIAQNSGKSIGEVKKSLTPEQEEYFKDSVVRDEDGNLKVMYHGTSKGGHTVFDPYGKANYGLFGAGSYFTDSKAIAESYTKKGKGDTPQVYESYLNIKNPIDMDAEADADAWRNALPEVDFPQNGTNEQFYRAMEEYFEDMEYARWEAAETAMGVIEEMGYDGITHIGGGRVDADGERHRVYIAFQPEQIKNIDNAKPTSDPDIRFSLSEAVEESNNLIAMHNLNAGELLKALDLGGLAMPSIAVIKAETGHDKYGDVSLILPKESIDPQTNRDNKVYGGDAWTPTFPRIEYDVGDTYKIKTLFENMLGADVYHALHGSSYLDSDRLAKELENNNGNIFEAVKRLGIVKYGYLQSIGKRPETGTKQKTLDGFGRYRNDQLLAVFEAVDGETIRNANYDSTEALQQIADALNTHVIEQLPADKKESVFKALAKKPLYRADNININAIQDAYEVWEEAGRTIPTEADYYSLENALRDNQALEEDVDYQRWVEGIFGDIIRGSGIYNGKDYYTPSGNRRGWDALHWETTLENIVRVMKSQNQTGADTFVPTSAIMAVSQKDYGSIADIKADSDRLGKLPEEEYKAIEQSYVTRFASLAESIKDPRETNPYTATDYAAELLVEAVREYKTKTGMLRYLQKWNSRATSETVDELVSIVNGIANMPTGYFEAKPRRAVGFDEVGVFVIPRNADVKLKQELLNRGYAIAEYDPDVEGDRQKVVNSFEQYKFSLSDVGDTSRNTGGYAVYGDNIRIRDESELGFAPIKEAAPEDIAPVRETTPVQEDIGPVRADAPDVLPDDGLPGAETDIDSLTDADVPPIPESTTPEEGDAVAPSDPFENRDIKDVGNRKVNAYMYENPEVKPFFQEEANIMLGELQRTTKGERFYNMDVYYETNGQDGITGTSRNTSQDIAYLLDELKYSYKQIEAGLRAIIEDNGKENNAVSKRIEFLLNDRLMNGYQDFELGIDIPPNQDYVNLLNEKQIIEYNEEARQKFFETADDFAPMVDAPMRETNPTITEAVDDIAPVKGRDYEAVTPKKTENRLVRRDVGTQEEQQIARVLDEEPKPENREKRAWARFVANVFDKGAVFEKVALKNKNRELMGKWNYMLYSEARAQRLMSEGTDYVKSLHSIQEEVGATGKTQEFYEYLYHKHNVDRMNLAERYEDKGNLPVFGYSVTSEMSDAAVRQLEAANPEFAAYAQDIYDYNNHLRQLLVDNGVISQETADLWAEMYPHYVPIRRAGDKGIDINVPLDTGRTGVNAPVKRATGGNSDILPLFETMAQRTLQTYKAIAKNSFGVELKNTLGTTIETNPTDVDDIIDTIDAQDGLLQEGKNGRSPTFTVFENGEKVTYEITKDMYDALKPMSEGLAYTNKVLNTASNFHRGLLTEYNPVFMLTNALKDVQDILINSQHPGRTYAKIPEAFAQLTSKGYWYKEYMENGGEQNTYFDNETGTFKTENKGIKKLLDIPPLSTISALNNFIEMTPRLAEYIASREAGRSVEVSMLDAARVTTNFRAGGDITKFLNRNGATFLNASVQGAMQQVRNIREAKANGLKGWVALATKFALAGLPALLLNGLVWDDDDEYEELSDYVKQNYYVVAKTDDGKFIRIPKGRTLAVIQSAFDQVSNALTGDDEVDLKSFLELAVSNLAPNNPIENNILAPIIQVANNKTWYGEDLVPTRLQDLPAAEQFDESTDALSKWLGQKTNISPIKINYLLDQYSGGLGDTVLPMLTPEAESGDNSLVGNLLAPLKSKFTTDSVMNNQNVSDFYDKKDELTTNAKASGATDKDILKNKYMNSINAELAELYAQKREIQNSSLSDKEKYEQVRTIQNQIVNLTRESLDAYENVNIDGEYATVGDKYFKLDDEGEWRKMTDDQVTKYLITSEAEAKGEPYGTNGVVHYRQTDEGEWTKISDKQLERQNEVTKALGITPSEYWTKTDISFIPMAKGEYESAYEYPENYAVSKAVGGYEAFSTYSSELHDIKADKDADGKSISGSRKEKVLNYINSLDINYGEKLILFKNEYNSDDTYNNEIIDYLNSREDLSYAEIETILKKIGFEVDSEGNIYW